MTKKEIQAEMTKVETEAAAAKKAKTEAAKASATRGAQETSNDSSTIAMDDDEFAIDEVQEMTFGGSFGGGITISAGGTSMKSQKDKIVDLFNKYDKSKSGEISSTDFHNMCISLLNKANCVSDKFVKSFTEAKGTAIIIAALDQDGDGAVQLDEFVSWIKTGLQRSKSDRKKFAAKSQLNNNLELFLQAVEESMV